MTVGYTSTSLEADSTRRRAADTWGNGKHIVWARTQHRAQASGVLRGTQGNTRQLAGTTRQGRTRGAYKGGPLTRGAGMRPTWCVDGATATRRGRQRLAGNGRSRACNEGGERERCGDYTTGEAATSGPGVQNRGRRTRGSDQPNSTSEREAHSRLHDHHSR